MSFVLDVTSMITYLSDLPGSDIVEEILENAANGKARVYVNYITLSELYQVIGLEFSVRKANEIVATVKRWPVSLIPVEEGVALTAGRLAAEEEISLLDAIAVATAMDLGAALVTTNRRIGEIFDDTIILSERT